MLKRTITAELIKKFNEMLYKILDDMDNKNYEGALDLIDTAFKDIFRLSIKFFNSLSLENIMEMVKINGSIVTDKCIIMAKLLEEEGNALEFQNKLDDAFYIHQKSLNLFLEAYLNESTNCDLKNYFSDIDPLINKLCEYKLSFTLLSKIAHYYAETKRYDKADDVIYEMLEENNHDAKCVEFAIKFYENLLLKNDNDLNSGNLPREEIEESLSSLRNILQNK
ncbi:DUF6483 family protein [Clostridium sp. AWRP]|uniref:DUF6483 family protein n=1 Tax=Clostridium sp. AWRP TaxID=2212991 RepID=UPI000FDCAFF5|nr:DUF6483 family protein [Clostridium sp. AWRP]AZV58129.1 hypothetical protein DMR38_16845 [Clostridium sp. AWRP]